MLHLAEVQFIATPQLFLVMAGRWLGLFSFKAFFPKLKAGLEAFGKMASLVAERAVVRRLENYDQQEEKTITWVKGS